jgi:tRNA(Ile2) C34 agmatinyltransferase TiaS
MLPSIICSKCGERFELVPGKPGYSNICSKCTESFDEQARKAAQEELTRKAMAAMTKANTRRIESEAKERRKLDSLGYEIVRRVK